MFWLTERFKEKSTWAVLITLAVGLLGRSSSPENQQLIMNSTIAVLSAIGVLTPEEKK